MARIPFLTAYDPPGTSEGTLDPLGLYQIADQLAVRLVPAVRERMQRVRFLTAMSLGALVTEGIDGDAEQPEAAPFLVWEWLVVEAIIRTLGDDPQLRGVPGTLVTQQALAEYNYLDHRSYLKTPRIFGFNGVYKRLAIRLELVDVHLGQRTESERLVDAWARDAGYGGLMGCRPLLAKWRQAVERSLATDPARTRPSWRAEDWAELAEATAPHRVKSREKRYLRDSLHATDDRALGALPTIWRLQSEFTSEDFAEEPLHKRLEEELPTYTALLHAIRAYESFCRGLHDGFDLMRSEAAAADARGFEIISIGQDDHFAASLQELDPRYIGAYCSTKGLAETLTGLVRSHQDELKACLGDLVLSQDHKEDDGSWNYEAPVWTYLPDDEDCEAVVKRMKSWRDALMGYLDQITPRK